MTTPKEKGFSPSKAGTSGGITLKPYCIPNKLFPCEDQLNCELADTYRATLRELRDKGLEDEFLLFASLMSSGSAHISLCRSLLKISEPVPVAEHLNALGHGFKIRFDPIIQKLTLVCI